jgi:hypothetical protein
MAENGVGFIERMTVNESIMNYYWTTKATGVHN